MDRWTDRQTDKQTSKTYLYKILCCILITWYIAIPSTNMACILNHIQTIAKSITLVIWTDSKTQSKTHLFQVILHEMGSLQMEITEGNDDYLSWSSMDEIFKFTEGWVGDGIAWTGNLTGKSGVYQRVICNSLETKIIQSPIISDIIGCNLVV